MRAQPVERVDLNHCIIEAVPKIDVVTAGACCAENAWTRRPEHEIENDKYPEHDGDDVHEQRAIWRSRFIGVFAISLSLVHDEARLLGNMKPNSLG